MATNTPGTCTLAEVVAALRIALEREAGCKCRALYCRHTSAAIDAAWAVVAAVRGEEKTS